MVSGNIKIVSLVEPSLNGFFEMSIILNNCAKTANVTLTNSNGKFHTSITKSEFVQVIKNIKAVFNLAQLPNIKLYNGPDLVVNFTDCHKTNTFINTRPKVSTSQFVQPLDDNTYNGVIENLILLRNKLFSK